MQRRLRQEGLAQKVDEFLQQSLQSDSRPTNLAGVDASSLQFVSFRDEDIWADLKSRINSGDLTKALGINSVPSRYLSPVAGGSAEEQWNMAIFFYFAMRAKDELLRRNNLGEYANYSWQTGDSKRWLVNLDDIGILASASYLWKE